MEEEHGEEKNDSPVEEVRDTVPITDDHTLPTLTFRLWVLGLSTCLLQGFMGGFSSFRQYSINIPYFGIQIAVLAMGKFMAATLPTKSLRVPGTSWRFSLNPGPFNMKEHALIFIFAGGGGEESAIADMAVLLKAYYHKKINPWRQVLRIISSQLMGYGFAGVLMRFLVDSPYMWWPSQLVNVTLYRVLHEKEERPRRQLTRMQFFLLVFVCSFGYYIVPGYFFPSISSLSILCWIWKNSITAQQIGAARNGLGLGSIGLDWSIMSILGPIVTPLFSINNTMIGFILFFYIVTPFAYWTNLYNAKRFPIFTSDLFDATGKEYNVSRVLDMKTFRFDQKGYEGYSKMYFSIFFAFTYGSVFAAASSTITHVIIYHGRSVWRQVKDAHRSHSSIDIHNRLMKKYDRIPQWWFLTILFSTIIMGIITSKCIVEEYFRMPYWLVPSASVLGLILALATGLIEATTNQGPPVGIIPELIMGYMYPGRPIANIMFKTYSTESMAHALSFIRDLKLGHYMKIPPKSMFVVQILGSTIGSLVNFGVSWWLLSTVKDICTDKLPKGSPWTCPSFDVLNSVTTIWGVVGPGRVFAPHGIYSKLYIFFLVGVILTVLQWTLSRLFPKQQWIKLVYVPLIFGALEGIPPGRPVENWSSWFVAILYRLLLYKRYKEWRSKYAYVLVNGLDAGMAIMVVLTYFALQSNGINGLNWWGLEMDDHCKLARCPTAPGIEVEGCPVSS